MTPPSRSPALPQNAVSALHAGIPEIPVGLPIVSSHPPAQGCAHFPRRPPSRLPLPRAPFHASALDSREPAGSQCGKILTNRGNQVSPLVQDPPGPLTLCGGCMFFHEFLEDSLLVSLRDRTKPDEFRVAACRKVTLLVHDPGHSSRHSRREIAPCRTQDNDLAPRHVFAAVVPDRLDNRRNPAVSDAEPLTCDAANERLACCRTVKRNVANDDVLFGHEGRTRRWNHDDLPAGKPLANVIVRVAPGERASSRAARTLRNSGLQSPETGPDRVVGKALRPPLPRHFAAEHRSDHSVAIADRQSRADRCSVLESRAAERDQRRHVERILEVVLVRKTEGPLDVLGDRRLEERLPRKVESPGFSVVDGAAHLQPLTAAHHLVERVVTEVCHQLRRTSMATNRMKLTTWEGSPVKRRRSSGSCVATPTGQVFQMTHSHHDAPENHQRSGCKTELLGPEEGRDDDVAACLQLAIRLQGHTAPEIIENEHLVYLRDQVAQGMPAC